jgi:hypothetical protein
MIKRTTEILPYPYDFTLSIVEAEDQLIRDNFNDRFQLVVYVKGKLHVPKNKKRYLEFETYDYLCPIMTDNDLEIQVPIEAFLEKQICDKSLEDCNTELLKYLSIYNEGKDVRKYLKFKYSI